MKISEYKDKTVKLRGFAMDVNNRRVDQIRRELSFRMGDIANSKAKRRLQLAIDTTDNLIGCLRSGNFIEMQRVLTELRFKMQIIE